MIGVGGQVVHLVGIARSVVKRFGGTQLVALDQGVDLGLVPGIAHPGRPVGVVKDGVAFQAHEVFLDVEFSGGQIQSVAEFAVEHRPGRVRRALRNIIVHPVGEGAVLGLLAEKDPVEGSPVQVLALPSAQSNKGGQNVGILDHGVGALALRYLAWPTGDEGGVKPRIPGGPFATGKLRTLFGTEKNHRVLRLSRILEGVEDVADLSIHISDLGQVFREVFPGAGGICDIWGELEFFGRVLGGITHHPGHVRFSEGNHETEGFGPFSLHEFANRSKVVSLGRVAYAIGVEALDLLEGKNLLGADVALSGQTDPIPELAQSLWHSADPGPTTRMIPGAPVAQRVKTGIQFRPARLAHGGGQISPVESHSLRSQSVDMRRLGILPAVEGQVVVGTVIRQNQKKIRGLASP